MRYSILTFILLIFPIVVVHAQHDSTGHGMSTQHNHSFHNSGISMNSPLTEPGNDIFGTIQEVIQKLEENPNTDWSNVDIEALRQHLLDMKAMTESTEVINSQPVKNGVQVSVRPTTKRADQSLKRVFDAHPAMLKKETGWTMKVNDKEDLYQLKVTTDNPDEVSKIRGLGYIGIMAYGAHHQKHHWMMATDGNPHKQ